MDIRKQRIETLIDLIKKKSDLSVDFEFISEHDPNVLKSEDLVNKINLTKLNNGELFDSLVRNLHVNQISNAMKHATAISKAAASASASASAEYDAFMVIEDDVLNGDDVADKIKDVVIKIKGSTEYDLVFLGMPSLVPLDGSSLQFKNVFDSYKVFPCCDSYIGTKATFEKLASTWFPIKYTANIQLTYLCQSHKISAHMAVPNVFLDGSKYGAYLSSVDANSKLVFNPEFNRLANMVNQFANDKSLTSVKRDIDTSFDSIKFKNHPDVMHLSAVHLINQGEYTKAAILLENVYNIVTQNGCILNAETEFLRTYMRLHKYIQ